MWSMQSQISPIDIGDDVYSSLYCRHFKRILDLIIAVPLAIVLLPVMGIIAIVIRLDSSGDALFKQERAGIYGRPFIIYKFRTMVADAYKSFELDMDSDNMGDFVFQDRNDSRITRVGSFLRRTSLDELPQLFNIIRGDMSLIGPRPEIYDIVNMYDERQRRRLIVRPGLTGLAQVMGRGDLKLDETITYDIQYIDKLSFRADLWILWRTIGTVLWSRGGY